MVHDPGVISAITDDGCRDVTCLGKRTYRLRVRRVTREEHRTVVPTDEVAVVSSLGLPGPTLAPVSQSYRFDGYFTHLDLLTPAKLDYACKAEIIDQVARACR